MVVAAGKDVVNGNYAELKKIANTNKVRIAAIELSELRRVFNKPSVGSKIQAFIDKYVKNDLDHLFKLIGKSEIGCEILSLLVFDRDCRDQIEEIHASEDTLDFLESLYFQSGTELDMLSVAFATIHEKRMGSFITELDALHDLMWIRPGGGQVCFAQDICWNNITVNDLKDGSCLTKDCKAILNTNMKEDPFNQLVNTYRGLIEP